MPRPPKRDYIDAVPFPDTVSLTPIGRVRSPYRQRYGTPRQSTVTDPADPTARRSTLELFAEVIPRPALKDLEGFEVVWVVSWFHLNEHWKPQVCPPRGPKVARGVLATRAPHRPNQLGLSATRLERIEGHTLHVFGLDLLDNTPILDIKPYVPYADAFPEAAAGWVDALPTHDRVVE